MDESRCSRWRGRALHRIVAWRSALGKRSALALLTLGASLVYGSGVANAQESGGWDFRLTPYLWALALDGTTAAAGNDVPVDADFGDILDLANFAFSVNMELNNGQWFVVLDPMYADLEMDIETGGPFGGTVEIELILVDALVGYSFTDYLDVYTGARYYDQDITIIPEMLPEVALGDDWTDILLGVRFQSDISEKWSFTGKLDGAIGGDSDSAIYVQALFLRHIGDNMMFSAGYRYYDVDYESGSGLSLFNFGSCFNFCSPSSLTFVEESSNSVSVLMLET